MTAGQAGAACPQCGSAAAVHSIGELAALARAQLGESPGFPPPGFPPPQESGFPQPQQDWFGQQPPPGFPPIEQPQAPPPPMPPPPVSPAQRFPRGRRRFGRPSGAGAAEDGSASIEDALTDAAISAATRFIGRAIGRRVQRTLDDRVLPAMAARQEAMLRQQIAVAERHPDLRACLADNVVFLVGGRRCLPMPSLAGGITVEQSDTLVARLRDG